ncbi:SigE family RNA polymerase sigma factor [Spirillospora sp. NPDC048911]|uniref:SigE family RNA polymerase sigma factor n=1 Tax=Spirillospora sp. NPDC048911 TaxID=3364527 RepID=UPI0037184803
MDHQRILESSTPADVGRLYRDHVLSLIRLAMLMVGDSPTAEDVVQEAFLGLHRRQGLLRDPDRALAYVRSAVLNRCRSVLRRRAVARRFGQSQQPPAWSAEDGVLATERRHQMLAAIARLPLRQREVLALRFYCDLPENEIAGVLGISRGTVSSTTSRALTALAQILEEES